ncbi:MAG: prolipoprotein diacylglyceryl transferase, partial [Phycisphaerales bacterium]|nr:prolipoprotein diacylglyceryl transferase [Phycisphaerales bacterium]
ANFINGELLGVVVAKPGEAAPWWSVRFPQELMERPTPEQQAQVLEIAREFGQGAENSYDAAAWLVGAVQRGNPEVQAAVEPIVSARAPSQLLQAFMEGVVLLAVLWWIWRRPRRPGVVGAWFLMVYGASRVLTEVWRLPDEHLSVGRPLGLSRGQWLSVAMVGAGAALLWWVLRRSQREPVGGWLVQAEPETASIPS